MNNISNNPVYENFLQLNSVVFPLKKRKRGDETPDETTEKTSSQKNKIGCETQDRRNDSLPKIKNLLTSDNSDSLELPFPFVNFSQRFPLTKPNSSAPIGIEGRTSFTTYIEPEASLVLASETQTPFNYPHSFSFPNEKGGQIKSHLESRRRWKESECQELINAYNKHKKPVKQKNQRSADWKAISEEMKYRNAEDCRIKMKSLKKKIKASCKN
jgi:Myb-like DNA-binding domain